MEERFNKQLYEAGKISSELSVNYESQLLQTERLLANVQDVAAALQANDPDTLRALALGIIANDGQEAVEFFDLHGNHILSVHHRPYGNPEDYYFSSGGQSAFTTADIVQKVLAQQSDTRGDKFAGLIKTDLGQVFYVSGPIHDAQGKLAGVVLVGRSLAKLAADMRAKTFAQITYYDETGHVIYSTLPSPVDIAPELAAQTLSFKDIQSTLRPLPSQRDLEIVNIPYPHLSQHWRIYELPKRRSTGRPSARSR